MNCLECQQVGGQSAATAVCTQCGAAVCPRHLTATQQYLTCTQPVDRTVAIEPAVRRILCTHCTAGHQAHAQCCPGAASTARMR
ncbi:DUF2180 family protein [Streptomyces sp. NPDC046685]|uniref:DUF2180 family protein n=1 Tax=Streptomyces sp. NPDC046685 TaxID=3157202 RepID=UPI0033C58418